MQRPSYWRQNGEYLGAGCNDDICEGPPHHDCPSVSPGFFLCTLWLNHKGLHEAWGIDPEQDKPFAVWA